MGNFHFLEMYRYSSKLGKTLLWNFTSYLHFFPNQMPSHAIPGPIYQVSPSVSEYVFSIRVEEVEQMIRRGEIHLGNSIDVIIAGN